MKLNFKTFVIAVTTSFLLVVSIIGFMIWKAEERPTYGGNFTLTYKGQPWKFSYEAKPLNLIYFGYVKCPDVCPLTMTYVGGAFRKLSPEELKKVRFMFLSVDQAHDKPEEVAEYAQNFFPSFLGLSGSKKQIDDTINMYPASYMVEKDPKSYLGYSIIHTDRLFFLDDKGHMIDAMSSPRDSEKILEKIKEHL